MSDVKKVKESWSREEVEHLLFKLAGNMYKADKIFGPKLLKEFIQQNL